MRQAPSVRRLLLFSTLALASCGYIGEPLPPSLNMPSQPQSLRVLERGSNLVVEFVIPPLTTDAVALRHLAAVEIRANGQITRMERDEPGPVRAEIPVDGLAGGDVSLDVRAQTEKGRASQWSAPVTLHVEEPLATPRDLRGQAVPEGVRLTWSAAGGELKFRVLRRDEKHPEPVPIGEATAPPYTDRTAVFGTEYEYSVQALEGAAESEIAAPLAIRPKDTFPPGVPAGLSITSLPGSIKLTWERNAESDFKGYRIYRAIAGREFQRIATDVSAPAYSDHDVEAGTEYRYRVTAVDQSGNESAPSATVQAPAR